MISILQWRGRSEILPVVSVIVLVPMAMLTMIRKPEGNTSQKKEANQEIILQRKSLEDPEEEEVKIPDQETEITRETSKETE